MVPSLFISHGSPALAIADNDYTNYLKELGQKIKPKAIVIFTAHWESNTTAISYTDDIYEMIYDFGGFQEELYSIKYPAKGSVEIAIKLQAMLEDNGIAAIKDTNRGLDHGAWVVLRLMYPNAQIPVVQVSVNPMLSPEEQLRIGRAIRGLGAEDILVIGSGGTVHNLWSVKWGASKAEKWAVDFDDWLVDKVEAKDIQSLFQYDKLAPNAKMAVPREEHFVPLFIAMGSGQSDAVPKLLHRSYDLGTLSQICFQF